MACLVARGENEDEKRNFGFARLSVKAVVGGQWASKSDRVRKRKCGSFLGRTPQITGASVFKSQQRRALDLSYLYALFVSPRYTYTRTCLDVAAGPGPGGPHNVEFEHAQDCPEISWRRYKCIYMAIRKELHRVPDSVLSHSTHTR